MQNDAIDPGCVKTLEAIAVAQERKRTLIHDESFMRERQPV